MEKRFTCCICGRECEGWGNNPWPVVEDEGASCCDECNATVVIAARIKQAWRKAKEEKKEERETEKTFTEKDIMKATQHLISLFQDYVNDTDDSEERANRDADVYPMVFGANALYSALTGTSDKSVLAAVDKFHKGEDIVDKETGTPMRSRRTGKYDGD